MTYLEKILLTLVFSSLNTETCEVENSKNITQMFPLTVECPKELKTPLTVDSQQQLKAPLIDECHQPLTRRYLILTIFCGIVCFTGLVGNTITVVVITLSRHLRSRSSYLLLASLALSDIGVSSFVTTVKVDMYYHNGSFCHGLWVCILFQITDSLFVITSLTHLLVLAVDRWYAVSKPYNYIRIMTRRKAKIVVLSIWSYSLVWMLLGLFKWDYPVVFSYELIQAGSGTFCQSYNRTYFTALVMIIYVLPMCLMIKLNIFTVQVARKTSRNQPVPSMLRQRKRPVTSIQDMSLGLKAIRTVGMVITAYIICWLPHVLVIIIQYWCVQVLVDFYHSNPTAYDIITAIISNILPTLNSCINPLIYCVFSGDFRGAVRGLVRKWFRMSKYGKWGGAEVEVVQPPRRRKIGVSVIREYEACDIEAL